MTPVQEFATQSPARYVQIRTNRIGKRAYVKHLLRLRKRFFLISVSISSILRYPSLPGVVLARKAQALRVFFAYRKRRIVQQHPKTQTKSHRFNRYVALWCIRTAVKQPEWERLIDCHVTQQSTTIIDILPFDQRGYAPVGWPDT